MRKKGLTILKSIKIGVWKCLILCVVFYSCDSFKKEQDKYPEMPLFTPNIKCDLVFEEIKKPVPLYSVDTDKYVFFKNRALDELLIYDKNSRKLLKKIHLPNLAIGVDFKASIYGFDEEKNKAYCYKPPRFEREYLETKSLNYVSNDSLEKKYISEIKNIEEGKQRSFLSKKRYEILKETIIDSLRCITKLYDNIAIAHFKNKDICIENSNFLHVGTFIKTELKGVKLCDSATHELEEGNYFGKNPLTLFDKVTLDYKFSARNHYVIGVDFKSLYYYELALKNKSIKFKSPEIIKNIVNMNGEVIIEVGYEKYYRVSIKK